jgi:hypothetical protein
VLLAVDLDDRAHPQRHEDDAAGGGDRPAGFAAPGGARGHRHAGLRGDAQRGGQIGAGRGEDDEVGEHRGVLRLVAGEAGERGLVDEELGVA